MKKNIKENFEEVYLRSNILKKYMKKIDLSLFQNKNFNRIVSYLTKKHYNKSKNLFRMNGFEIDDVNNIIIMYSLIFWSHSKVKTRTKKDFLTMIRYVNQRMFNFTRWVVKKFNVNDVSLVSVDFNSKFIKSYDTDYNSYWNNNTEELLVTDDKKPSKNKALSLKDMKSEFYENPLKYKKDLCYYATTKHVSEDVRKKARIICKKYNINYSEWLKNESKKTTFDFSDYTY